MQNALLHLEFQQANFTDTVLFATYDSRTFHNLLLAVESSTKFDQVFCDNFLLLMFKITLFFMQE